MASLDITYVPADCGSVIPGKSKAPQAFRDVGIVDKLRSSGISVKEHHALKAPATYAIGDFEPGRARNEQVNLAVSEQVYSAIGANLKSKHPPFQLIIGGECSMLPPVVSAFWKETPKRIGLVYVDADTDLASTADPGFTGVFAGMTMTHLIGGRGLEEMKQYSQKDGAAVCDASNTVFFGTNMSYTGNKREHLEYLMDNDYKVVSSASVSSDPQKSAQRALGHMDEHGVEGIVVHLDVDSIDPLLFPLANVPNYTGVTFERMMEALSVLLSSEKVVGFVIAEVNPDHDPGLGMTARLVDHVAQMLQKRFNSNDGRGK